MAERPYALSVVIPVYNGAATIGRVVNALAEISIPGGMEVVLVYDGSPDNSLEVCRALQAEARLPITVIAHSRNYGEHNAVMTGFRHARGAYVINMDDDLQNPPSEVKKLYEHCRDGGYDVVYTYYDRKEHEGWRNWGSWLTNRAADFLLDKPKGLYLSSFRCMSAFVVEQVTRYDGPFPYVDGLIMQVTQSIGTIKVQHLPRAEGHSNYTMKRLVALWLSMALNFSVIPLRVATLVGLVTCLFGLLGLVVVVIEALINSPPVGWGSTVCVVLIVSGAQLLMLGIIGEYLGRLYLTVNKRPQSSIRVVTRPPEAARDLRAVTQGD